MEIKTKYNIGDIVYIKGVDINTRKPAPCKCKIISFHACIDKASVNDMDGEYSYIVTQIKGQENICCYIDKQYDKDLEETYNKNAFAGEDEIFANPEDIDLKEEKKDFMNIRSRFLGHL